MTVWIIISSFLSGMLGAMGFGGGSVLIIYLTLFANVPQLQAQGVNLLFFIPCAAVSVIVNIKSGLVKYKTGGFIILGGLLGLAAGILLSAYIKPHLLSKLFGGLVFIMGLVTLFGKNKKGSDKNA